MKVITQSALISLFLAYAKLKWSNILSFFFNIIHRILHKPFLFCQKAYLRAFGKYVSLKYSNWQTTHFIMEKHMLLGLVNTRFKMKSILDIIVKPKMFPMNLAKLVGFL